MEAQTAWLKRLHRMKPGEAVSDPTLRGLRYRRRGGGIFAEVRWMDSRGKRQAKGLGRLSTEAVWSEGKAQPLPGTIPYDKLRDKAVELLREIREGGTDLLGPSLDQYEGSLKARGVVNVRQIMSLLRRELLEGLGNVALGSLDRRTLVERINEVEASGRPGAARELKTRSNVFLGWAADQGLIGANPLAGLRRPRRTRAQVMDRAGRALSDGELGPLWRACEATGAPFGPLLQLLLLLGQRRTETTMMRWEHVDLKRGVWAIPTAMTKSARAIRVPLPPLAVKVLRGLGPKDAGLVFAGRKGQPMTGWAPRMRGFRTANPKLAHFTLHDLRRTMRTGLGRLGVDVTVAELMLNHAVSDELRAIYDRAEYWRERVAAARKWASHVAKLV